MSELQQFVDNGMTVKQIAEKIGLSVGGARKRLKKAGLRTKRAEYCNANGSFKEKPWQQVITKDEAADLYLLQLKSTTEIAKIKGCSKQAIRAHLKTMGICRRSSAVGIKLRHERYPLSFGFKKGQANPGWGKNTTLSESRGKWVEYAGIVFKSSYEAAFAKWCDDRGMVWEYEPQRFVLDNGRLTYAPDFRVEGKWIEIKGWMTPRGQDSIDQFRKDGFELLVLRKNDLIGMGVL